VTEATLKTLIEITAGVTLAVPVGRLDFEASTGFQQAIEQAIAGTGTSAVVVDCAQLEYVSSAGLRVFLIGARAAKQANVRFSVCGLLEAVRRVFVVSGFDKLIVEHADRAAALAALQ
jgi:anti-anti-sigma factor